MKQNKNNQHSLPRLTPIALFLASVGLLGTVPSSIAVPVKAVSAEAITGTAPSGSATFGVRASPTNTDYTTSQTIYLESAQSPSALQFNGALTNITASDIDSDINPTLTVATSVADPIQYTWFDGSTLIANADSLANLSAYAGKLLTVEVAVPVVAATETGFPRNNLAETGRPSQFITQRFNVQVAANPTIIANGANFALNAGFPKTGFQGASFTLQAPFPNNLYSWQSSEGSLAGVTNGVVTLLSMPADANKPIKITATPNAELVAAGATPFEYTFTLAQWYIHNGSSKGTRDANAAFCNSQTEGNYRVPSFAYNLLNGNSRAANGYLWNEWGNLSTYTAASPAWAANGAGNLYWAAEVGGPGKYELYQQASLTNGTTAPVSNAVTPTTASFQACVRNLDGTEPYPIPSIADVRLDGVIAEANSWQLSYRFNANGGGTDTSTYYQTLGSKGTGATQILASNTLVSGVFDTLTGITKKAVPVTLAQSTGVAEFSVRPINSNNIAGIPVTIDTSMNKDKGNQLTGSFHSISTPVIDANFPIKPLGDAENFPKTGFNGAQFRLNIGDANGIANNAFTWQAQLLDGSATDLVTVTNGLVTMVKEPAQATEIAIIATPTSGTQPPLRYEFKVEKWFYPDLPMPDKPITRFNNIKAFYNPTSVSFDVNQGFPKTGFLGAKFYLNLEQKGVNINPIYTWSTSHPDLVSIDSAGMVTMIKKPERKTPITITAMPPAGNGNPPVTYTFAVETWFEPNFSFPTPRPAPEFVFITTPVIPVVYGKDDKEFIELNDGFPTTGFAKAQFRINVGDAWDPFKDFSNLFSWSSSHPELVSVSANGTVTLEADPGVATEITITATPNQGVVNGRVLTYKFTLKEWWNPDFDKFPVQSSTP